MSEEGGFQADGQSGASTHVDAMHVDVPTKAYRPADILTAPQDAFSPMSPTGQSTPNPFSRREATFELDEYFSGPRDLTKHSKWPIFLQMHGSILPKMIVPLIVVGAWASAITVVSQLKHTLGVNSTLLTITGFVVSLSLSFRSSTAYERYSEGRRYWTQLILTSQNLGRVFWIHTTERNGELGERDILAKLSAMNLLVAFAVSLKHKLRYEPYAGYDDLASLISHLDTFSADATRAEPEKMDRKRRSFFKHIGEDLGVSFAASNPRKAIKRAQRPLGNLPLEILSYLASYVDECVANGQLPVPMQQTLAYNNIAALNDILTGTERVLTTPLPLAYAIAISQITWLYVILLPFQLVVPLGWIAIPATVVAAYIILGLLYIGREVENPFGYDVNDLPLENFCAQVAQEMDIIASRPKPRTREWIESNENRVLWPLSNSGFPVWLQRGEARVRAAIVSKTELQFKKEGQMIGGVSAQQAESGQSSAVRSSSEKTGTARARVNDAPV